MMVIRLFVKIVLLPVLLVVMLTRVAVNAAAHLYGIFAIWFWIFLGAVAIMLFTNQMWDAMVIAGGFAFAAFIVMFLAVWLEVLLEDIRDALKGYIFS